MREQLECIKLHPGTDKRFESLRVRLKGQTKMDDSLGCGDHEMVEFRIPCEGVKAISWTRTWDFLRANFGLFKDYLLESHGIRL